MCSVILFSIHAITTKLAHALGSIFFTT